MHGDIHGPICNLLHATIQLCYHHLSIFFPLYKSRFFAKNQMSVGVWIKSRYFQSDYIGLPLFICANTKCCNYYSSIIELEVMDSDAFRCSFTVQDCLRYPVSWPHRVEYCSFNIYEVLLWDFDRDFNESVGCFLYDCHYYYFDHTYP